MIGVNDDFDEFLSNAGTDERLSNWQSLCQFHHGLSGADDVDKF